MATRTPLGTGASYSTTPANPQSLQANRYWGQYAYNQGAPNAGSDPGAAGLPNENLNPLNDPEFAKLEIGDVAATTGAASESGLWTCVDPGTVNAGNAVWRRLDMITFADVNTALAAADTSISINGQNLTVGPGTVGAPGLAVSETDTGLYLAAADTLGITASGLQVARLTAPAGASPQFIVAVGTAAKPSISFSDGFATCGFYSPSAGVVGFVSGANERWRLNSGAFIAMAGDSTIRNADGTFTAPTYAFALDTGTGFYRKAAGVIGYTSGGTLCWSFVGFGFVADNPSCHFRTGGGTAAIPSISFAAAATDGFYSIATGTVGFTAGGLLREAMTGATVSTADATVTTLASVTLTDARVYWISALVIGRKSDGTERAFYLLYVRAHRQGAGAVLGTVAALVTDESDAAWDCTFDASGNDVRVRVTGVAATTIKWSCRLSYQLVD